ncbi:MAG: peptide-methionine (S)-S-oxide reductase MsrA [Myxococcales bacterium]|nr:peptide-methionine (S)-S-oxide reductase MsrA [Myxococcales bacterium]
MMKRMADLSLAALTAFAVLSFGCEPAKSAPARAPVPKPAINPTGPREVAILAGGCFWGMEKVMNLAPGIVSIDVGYAGGKSTKVTYEQVSSGDTGHAEVVRIVFDPQQISYEDLLAHWFFRGHDPTSLDRQGNDVGTQYRSQIFTTSDAQRATAEAVKARVDKTGKWKRPIVTKIEPSTTWVRAEEYHQDYLVKHPNGYDDHWLREFDF